MRLFLKKTGFLCIAGMLLSVSGYSLPTPVPSRVEPVAVTASRPGAPVTVAPGTRSFTTQSGTDPRGNTLAVVRTPEGRFVSSHISGPYGYVNVTAIDGSSHSWNLAGSSLQGTLRAETDGTFIYNPDGFMTRSISFKYAGGSIVFSGSAPEPEVTVALNLAVEVLVAAGSLTVGSSLYVPQQ